jgi:selenocysteine lyase/cysteine desulfurase
MICVVHVACWLLYVAIATDARMQIGFMHYNTEEEVDRVLEQLERM